MHFYSIIIPTFNRRKFLSIAIEALCTQKFQPDEYEILIVDNASTDETKEIVTRAKRRHRSHKIRYFYETVPGLLSGRHRGALEAKGDILIFIDDDTEPNPMWLSAIKEAFNDEEIQLVGGKNLPKYETCPPEWLKYLWKHRSKMSTLASLSLLDNGDEVHEIDPIFVWGLNFSIRKATFFEVGGFHPDCIPKELQRYQGDGEFGLSMKLKSKGYKALYHPGAWVYHRIPKERMTVSYFEERQFYQGVCDSFSNIRKKGGLGKFEDVIKKKQFDRSQKGQWNLFTSVSLLKSAIKERIMSVFKKIWDLLFRFDIYKIKRRMGKAYKMGYRFHQNEAANNPLVVSWILKNDYLNYQLPDENL